MADTDGDLAPLLCGLWSYSDVRVQQLLAPLEDPQSRLECEAEVPRTRLRGSASRAQPGCTLTHLHAAVCAACSDPFCGRCRADVKCPSPCAANGPHSLRSRPPACTLLRGGQASPLPPLRYVHRAPPLSLTSSLTRVLPSLCVPGFRRAWSDAECELSLWSCVLSVDGRQSVEWESSVRMDRSSESRAVCITKAQSLGVRVGQQLHSTGADRILADIR